ncbi:phage tail protein [Magnetospirillum molischianum]|uniref:Phage tail collar domain-containing protein n=1 Tax=Magnetospirillum molischianum DSM 120 TaxID=1150626 RepID=H8FV07_MAGML|nr:phage tail protein [Magnetospirillum molischianum]CCG42195.1 hypothetical protein PHAMO_340068 [Magnetospirillum molischianum DSM 120]
MGKYAPPVGEAEGAPYVDESPELGRDGSPVPAAAIEWPQRELHYLIAAAGLSPNAADLTQVAQAIQRMIAAGASAVVIQRAAFAPGIVNGAPVRWDAGSGQFALARADGTAADLAVGFADVSQGAVYCFGRSRAGLFAGLTPGSRYYLSASGTLSTAPAADGVYAGIALSADTLFIDIDPGQQASSAVTIKGAAFAPDVVSGCPVRWGGSAGLWARSASNIQVPKNLLLNPEYFDGPGWSAYNIYVGRNASVSPYGATAAYKIYENNATSPRSLFQQISSDSAQILTASIWVAPAGRASVTLVLDDSTFKNGAFGAFNLNTGECYAQEIGLASGAKVSMVPHPRGGWVLTLTGRPTAIAGNQARFILHLTSAYSASGVLANADYPGDGASGLFIADAVLIPGPLAAPVVGIADVANSEIVLSGDTRPGLLGGLVPGATYYTSPSGALVASPVAGSVRVGIAKSASVLTVDADLAGGSGGATAAIGEVAAFARSAAPDGWLKCNGAAVSRTTYADLFAAIGATFGAGDGSTTFNLPDLRGEFVRGVDDGRGVDSGRVIGSWQADELRYHNHLVGQVIGGRGSEQISPIVGTGLRVNYTEYTGGNESRPRNIALLYCIKYYGNIMTPYSDMGRIVEPTPARIVYQTDRAGRYAGAVTADPSPLEPGAYLIPGGCVESAPPEILVGQMAVWEAGAWALHPLPDDELRALAVAVDAPTDPSRIVTGWHPAVIDGRIVQVWDTRPETDSERKARVNAPLLAALDAIDAATVRPLRAVLAAQAAGTAPAVDDVARLTELDSQAAALRLRLVS